MGTGVLKKQVFNLREVQSEGKVHNHSNCEHSHFIINTTCGYVHTEMYNVILLSTCTPHCLGRKQQHCGRYNNMFLNFMLKTTLHGNSQCETGGESQVDEPRHRLPADLPAVTGVSPKQLTSPSAFTHAHSRLGEAG